jgi:transglutaminase-like putative cysteine protease
MSVEMSQQSINEGSNSLETVGRISVGCELQYEVKSQSTFIFCVAAANGINEKIKTSPEIVFSEDRLGTNRYHRIECAPGSLTLSYTAETPAEVPQQPIVVAEDPDIATLPISVFPFLLPSRYCPSDRLSNFALRQFSNLGTGAERVAGICNWIYESIEYKRGVSEADTVASETLLNRAGVCRDFAHLGISFCRALNIPARLVSCYAVGLQPPDFHAIFEAYLGGQWHLFDATRQANLNEVARIATSVDASGASFASIYGNAEPSSMKVWSGRL